MRRALRWTAVAALCGAAGAVAQDAGTNAQLLEAKAAFDKAQQLLDAGRYADGISYGERALALREAALGGAHPEVADCLDLLSELYGRQGHLDRCESLIQRGLAIREQALGKDHPDVASSLHNLADLYWSQGLGNRAEPLYERALAIREAALGKSHPDVASSLRGLAELYWLRGWYSRAEPLAQRALAIWEATLGSRHPSVSIGLNTLAKIYADQGFPGRAEPLLQRSLAIREAAFGNDSPRVADSLDMLADLYETQGAFSRALSLHQRALAIREAALGSDHPMVAVTLGSLAGLYRAQGLDDQAEPLLRRALAIHEAALGKNNPWVAESLENLAALLASQGHFNQAEPLYERALAIYEATLGKSQPSIRLLLRRLANVYRYQGWHGRAEPLLQRALAIHDPASHGDDPATAGVLNDLALLRLAQRRRGEALPLLARAFNLSEQRLRREALDFSESRLASLLELLRADEERLYALLRADVGDAGARHLALTAALLLKGRSAEEIAGISRTIYRGLGPRDRDAFKHLREVRTQVAMLSLEGPGSSAPAGDLQALTSQGDDLEADLAKRSASLRALSALPSPTDIVERVAAALPPKSALVELIAYADKPLAARLSTPEAKIPSQSRYLAVVLFQDGHTRALDLGPAAPIDAAVSRLHDALANRDSACQGAAQRLYQLAFRPLLPLLRGVHRLLIAPDGQLGLVPFAALHDGRHFLVDAFDFTYLTSGRDILPRPEDIPLPRSVVVLANPALDTPPAPPTEPPALAERSSSVERFFSTLRADVVDRSWVPLPGTREEAEALKHLFPRAQLLLGPEATKERLLHLETPGVLHIATHGFFFEDAATPAGSRGVATTGPIGGMDPVQRPPDPMLRSGLVLAGAKAGDAREHRLDASLVTALELAGLDLWGTQLVVLSACDTGRGDIKRGQGVYGLRRALVVAGTETLVVSLWKVDDQVTRTLMESYYLNLLMGQGRVAALRQAMLALRQQFPHPYYWASFIAIGHDAPLRLFAPANP